MIDIRDLREGDAEMIRQWRNKPTIARYMYNDHEISVEEHRVWFDAIARDPSVRYWIITCDGRDVGLVNLYGIDRRNDRCYWAFYVAEDGLRGRGVGSWVEFRVLTYVFDELGLDKLCCEVLATNPAVVEMHRSFGFQEEGLLRGHVIKDGSRLDVVCLGILRDDWLAHRDGIRGRLASKGII